jgi:hypothetical protein
MIPKIKTILIMGVPTFNKVDGLSQKGAMVDWLQARDVKTVYYNGAGKIKEWIQDVNQIHKDILNQSSGTTQKQLLTALFGGNWPKNFVNTWVSTSSNVAINWTSAGNTYSGQAQGSLPLWPIKVDLVICLINGQFRRQVKKNPKKLAWKQWYDNQGIPVLFMRADGIFEQI